MIMKSNYTQGEQNYTIICHVDTASYSSVYMVSSYRTVSTHIKRTAVRGHYVNYGL